MFHLLEVRSASLEALVAWMAATPVYPLIARRAGVTEAASAYWARAHVLRLVDEGALRRRGDLVEVPEHAQ